MYYSSYMARITQRTAELVKWKKSAAV